MTALRKPSAGFWITVALVAVLMGYPLSSGLEMWLQNRDLLPDWAITAAWNIYWPLDWIYANGPEGFNKALRWYWDLFR